MAVINALAGSPPTTKSSYVNSPKPRVPPIAARLMPEPRLPRLASPIARKTLLTHGTYRIRAIARARPTTKIDVNGAPDRSRTCGYPLGIRVHPVRTSQRVASDLDRTA